VNKVYPQSLNRYAYVENQPMSLVDPMGLWVWSVGGCYYDTVMVSVDGEFQGYDTQFDGCVQAMLGPTLDQQGQDQNYHPTVDCSNPPPLPPAPANLSIVANEQASQNNGTAWWLTQVAPGGNWDYKAGGNNQYTSLGNVNYGATCGALGNSLEFCQRGAGAAAYATATKNVLTGDNWTAGPGSPTGAPADDNGMPDYGDQTGGLENQSVIAGYGYQRWQEECQTQ
jgi:hypothetical protein